jgi:carboxyl-terminal processing protease
MRALLVPLGLVLSLLSPPPTHAQPLPGTFELEQLARPKLEEYARHAQAKEIREAVAVLHDLYTTPGMSRLESVWTGVLYNLACGHALLGERTQALSFLEDAVQAGFADLAQIQRDPDLAGLRDDPRFLRIVTQVQREQMRWSGRVLQTPYREELGEDERLAGLAEVWSDVKYNFVYFDHAPACDWDSLYLAYLPRVREARTTLDYYRLLQEMCAQLKDGHTGINVPGELFGRLYSRPPLDTRLIEGRVVVVAVLEDSLRKEGIRPGLEVLRVEGVPVREYAEHRVAPYQSASTPQSLAVACYEFYLLGGPRDQPVRVEFGDDRGGTFTRSLRRSYTRILSYPRDVEFRLLPGDIAWVGLNSFGQDQVVAVFDSLFPAIERARGLVLDLRRNTGGNSGLGFNILGYLTGEPFKVPGWSTLDYRPLQRAWGWGTRWQTVPFGEWRPRGSRWFRGPVVVLTSAQTGSAAEDFCAAFAAMNRGEIVGGPTAGSTGQPLICPLPGGGSLRVCTTRTRYPDGKEYVGAGVLPDVPVRETVRDVRAGRDAVLEAGLDRVRRIPGR